MGDKIDYLKLLRASEGMLSYWSRMHLQWLAPTLDSSRVDVRPAPAEDRKNNYRLFITTQLKTFGTRLVG
jgi:hypothetical protein